VVKVRGALALGGAARANVKNALHGDLGCSFAACLGAAVTEEVRHNKEIHCTRSKERDNIFKMV